MCWLPILPTNGPLSPAENIQARIIVLFLLWEISILWSEDRSSCVMFDMMRWRILCSQRAPKTVFRVRNQLEQINNKSCLGLDGLNGYSEVGNSLADVLNYVFGPHTSLSRWCEWNNKRVSSNLMINAPPLSPSYINILDTHGQKGWGKKNKGHLLIMIRNLCFCRIIRTTQWSH